MSDRSNILLIMTDQQRFDTISALGNAIIRTPSLDRLCEQGTVFNRAYTPSPVCVPARCSLVTGLPPHLTGCVDNMPQPQGVPSFMDHLAAAGYETHGSGKMHFTPDPHRPWGLETRDVSEEEEHAGDGDDYRAYVAAQGFGHVMEPHGLRSEYYYVPQPSQLPAEHHHTAWTVDRAIDFLRRRDPELPFFLFTSFIKPHPPFESPEPWPRLYRVPEMPGPFVPENAGDLLTYWNRVQNRYKYTDAGGDGYVQRVRMAAYYACISFIDYQIGRLLDALGDALDRTLVIFCADHGELLGDYGSYGKRSMLDAACRVPLIARWPERLPAGAIVEDPATLLDVFPTVMEAAGIDGPPPSDEGVSLASLAAGRADREAVFSQFQRGRYGLYMVATRRDKYVYSAPDQKQWYFDLEQDPRESRSAIDDPGAEPRVAALRGALVERHRRAGDRAAVSGGGWREYPPLKLGLDPGEGLLFQDSQHLQARIDELGPEYARMVNLSDGVAMRLLSPES